MYVVTNIGFEWCHSMHAGGLSCIHQYWGYNRWMMI